MTLAIPDPTEVTPADVPVLCDAVMATVAGLEDIGAIDELRKRLSMIDTYLDMTTTEGRNVIGATLRRIEVRIGKLLGPATVGAHSSAAEGSDLSRHQRNAFRKMAEYDDLVEDVIAGSSDASPASRRKTLDAISKLADVEAQEEAIGNGRELREIPEPPKSDLFDLTGIRLRLEEHWTIPDEHRPDVADELRRIGAALEQIKEKHT